MTVKLNINPNILSWAIEKFNLNIEDIYSKFPRLRQENSLTVKQAQSLAQKLNIPFGYLFLEQPPEQKRDLPFFRTANSDVEIDANTLEQIKILQKRQAWLSEFLQENDFPRLEFVGKFNLSTPNETILNDIYSRLDLKEGWTLDLPNRNKVIEYLVSKLEQNNIIVVFSSVVGNNNKRKISPNQCRGFVLVDDYAPFMFINSADWLSAQLFTLAHELAHIWLGQSVGFDYNFLLPADDQIERKCDAIAAEFLVPKNLILKFWDKDLGFESNLDKLYKVFKVSRLVIARRALDLHLINRDKFFEFYNMTKKKFAQKQSSDSGGNFYATQQKRLNRKFLHFIKDALQSRNLLYRDAYLLTGLKGKSFNQLLKNLH